MLRWALLGLAVLVVLVAGLLAAAPIVVDLPAVQAYVSQAAGQALGRPVRYQSLSVSALPLPAIRLRGLEVSDDPGFGPGPVVTVEEGWLGVRIRPLLSGRIELTHLSLAGVRVRVVEDESGRLNVATLGALPGAGRPSPRAGSTAPGPSATGVPLGRVTVRGGSIEFERRGPRPRRLALEDLHLTATSAGRPDEFDLTGHAVASPGGIRLSLAEGRLGPLGGRSLGEAPLRAVLEVAAEDVGRLAALVVSAPSLTGALGGTVTVEGPLSRLGATGTVEVERLVASEEHSRCPPPGRRHLEFRDVRVPLRYSPDGIESAPVEARVAGGTVSARVTSPDGGPVVIIRDLTMRAVQLEPLLVEYLCQGHAVTGPLDLAGEARLRADDPLGTLSGSGRIEVGPGRVVGAEAMATLADLVRLGSLLDVPSDLGGLATGRSPLSFDSITATYRIADGVVRTEDLLYAGSGFRVAAAGTYRLVDGRVEMHVTLHQGLNQVRALVTGSTAGQVRIVPTAVRPADPADLRRFIDRLLR